MSAARRPRLRPRTLSGRMVAVNAVLMALTLAAVAGFSAAFLRSYLLDRVDERLEIAAGFARANQGDIFAGDSANNPADLVEQVRTPSDFIVEFTEGGAPGTPDAQFHRLQGAGPVLLRDIDTASAPGGPFTVRRDGADYRVAIVHLPSYDTVALIGEPTEPVDETVQRLVAVEAVAGSVMLLVALGAGAAVIRRGLLPLGDVVDTAEAIASGDLERRVPAPQDADADETRRLTLSINRMLARLRTALHARASSEERMRRFVSHASHELRTPLTSVRGYLQMVAQGVVDVSQRPDVITRSQQESERMAAIVDDLLYLARLDERPEPRREVVELGRVVADSVADARAAQPEREWSADLAAEGLVLGDEQELRQAVANALANVRVHTPASSPASAALRRVDGRVVLEISDAGPGVAEETAEFVFERFYRGGPSAQRPGSGLGLPIVRAVMRGHGGDAVFTSAPEGGTTVRMEFPPLGGTGGETSGGVRADGSPNGREDGLAANGGFSSDSHPPPDTASSGPDEVAADHPTGTRGRGSMARLLYRLGGFAYRRRRLVVAAWLVVLIAAVAAAVQLRTPMDDTFSIPGTESDQATELMDTRFDGQGATVTAVLRAPGGADVVDNDDYAGAVADTAAELDEIGGVESVDTPHGALADAREQYRDGIADAEEEARERARDSVEEQIPEGTPNREALIAEQLPGAEQQALDKVEQESPEFDESEVVDEIPLFSDDRTTAMLNVQLTEHADSVDQETVDAILDTGDSARDFGMDVEFSGQAISMSPPEVGSGEAVGVVAALVILAINFGAVVAAGLPIVVALLGVGLGMALLYAATGFVELNSTAPILAMMLGIAVGIDYVLFVLSRHRKQVGEGMDPAESAARSIGTAGSAVVFAGITVVIALAGLSVVGIPFLTMMGAAAMVTVSIAVLLAITLLPALLGFIGHRVAAGRLPWLGRRADAALHARRPMSARWVRTVTRRPVVTVVAVLAVLVVALIPVRDLHLGLPTDATSATDTTQRQAYEIISEKFGPGHAAKLAVVADLTGLSDTPAAADDVAERLEEVDGVEEVLPPQLNGVEDTAIIAVVPETGPSSYATEDLLHDVRGLSDEIDEDIGARISVAGATATAIDVSESLADSLPVFVTVVIGLALILMAVVFRSIVVPVKAALGFVLSAGAALGLTVAVFQWGYGAGLLGVEPSPTLLAFMPTLLIGILFGLAMDYEVFLVSRMREDFVHGGDAHKAVATGFRQGARVVTAAAAIMVIVFTSFVFGDNEMVKPIAFVLAAGVLFDAFLVRMTLVPAVMALFGRAAWWLPKWLDALLPDVDIEGDRLDAAHPASSGQQAADQVGAESSEAAEAPAGSSADR
ncbi:MMPL family transporter [Streptomonospora salina]|uniref:histidine kinase n=1 Tax=Streptomonospora salina TaxID=104205 RepID=A0A841E752_9ACTN|nr:MMPL family transporter [Streptomonospora salina]MBB5999767.1 putative membrane protein YdfJ with MMPL/SSD domain/signal transduction histidine kinase [Streptomonospora salina]